MNICLLQSIWTKQIKTKRSSSVADILQVLQRLDSRSVPKPDIHDLASGPPVSELICTFEEYCRGTLRGSSSSWIGQLGRKLTSEIKVALDAMKAPGYTYETLREKLILWCCGSTVDRNFFAMDWKSSSKLRRWNRKKAITFMLHDLKTSFVQHILDI